VSPEKADDQAWKAKSFTDLAISDARPDLYFRHAFVTTSMYNMKETTRTRRIESTRELLWDRGYSATSPRAILDASGVGQGSMYHHFHGKEDLARAAMQRNAEEMRIQVDADLAGPGTAVEKVTRYLHRERDVLRGCRFGKLAQDAEVAASATLHPFVSEMFSWLQERLSEVIEQGQADGELPAEVHATRVAAMIAAALQGGYVLARAAQDPAAFDLAIEGALELLRAIATPR
jgi:AcrR family transcriptional regulator